MKIAHVINSLNRGGAESHLLELVKAQSTTGLITDVIVIGEDSSDILSIKKELSSVCILTRLWVPLKVDAFKRFLF